jgi:hypothetical protein
MAVRVNIFLKIQDLFGCKMLRTAPEPELTIGTGETYEFQSKYAEKT